jgi:hypothetical protein
VGKPSPSRCKLNTTRYFKADDAFHSADLWRRMSSAGRLHPSTVTHQPDAYLLQNRLILGIRQVSHVDRHITAVATFILSARIEPAALVHTRQRGAVSCGRSGEAVVTPPTNFGANPSAHSPRNAAQRVGLSIAGPNRVTHRALGRDPSRIASVCTRPWAEPRDEQGG